MKRNAFAVWIAVAGALLIGARGAAAADHVVLRWNAAALQAIRNTAHPPMRAARALAIVHTCIYDAWAAYSPSAVGTRLGGSLRRPPNERTSANRNAAISVAAFLALVDLFPTQTAAVFDPLMAALGYDAAAATSSAEVARTACNAVLAYRHADGANQLGDINGGAPYSDYTGYAPINTPDVLSDPNRWQPRRNPNGTVQVFAAPHWSRVRPFALHSADQFRPKPPARSGTHEYWRQASDLIGLSARLDDRRKAIAVYWADGPNSETPAGHWNLLAQWVLRRDGNSVDRDVKLFFALNNALLDASIAVWDAKRFYDYIRPVSAVRYLFDGRPIRAWAGPAQGTRLIQGEQFRSYIPTPPFAEYTSGHSAFSAAAARVLALATGSGIFGARQLIPAGSSFVEPGSAPAHDVALWWPTFDAAARQAGRSRRYGGIHFRDGDLESRRIGRKVGMLAWQTARRYWRD